MKSRLPYLSDEHLKAIAHVAVRSAQVDHLIEFLISDLMMPHYRTAEKVLKSWNQGRLVELLETLLKDRFYIHTSEIDQFLESLVLARRERNKVIHYLWGKADEAGGTKIGTYRPFRQSISQSMTANQVEEVADQLMECVISLQKILEWADPQREKPQNALAQLLRPKSSAWPLSQDSPELPLGLLHQPPPAQKSDPESE